MHDTQSSFKITIHIQNHLLVSHIQYCTFVWNRISSFQLFCCCFFEDLRRFSDLSDILRLGSRRWPISEIVAARPGIEPRTSCSASKSLTTTPPLLLFVISEPRTQQYNFSNIINGNRNDDEVKYIFLKMISAWMKLTRVVNEHHMVWREVSRFGHPSITYNHTLPRILPLLNHLLPWKQINITKSTVILKYITISKNIHPCILYFL